MRMRPLAVLVALVGLALAAPAAEGHWYGGRWYGGPWYGGSWYGSPWWGWGVGVGPFWWGGGWTVPPPGYGAVAVNVARTDVATVEIKATPEHARVVLDGELIGVADDFDGSHSYLYLRPGHYTLELTLKGYKPEKVEIDAERGRYVPINLKLERIPGENPAPWYDRPEGLPVRHVFGPKEAGAAGTATAGPNPSLRPELRENVPETAYPRGAASGAALDVRVTPSNAAIYIDGRFAGTGEELSRLERGLAVPPGKHRIDVVAPGRASKTIDVEVPEGRRQQIVVELEGGTGQT